MKVVAFNASPKMEHGGTAVVLNPFLDGLRETGADVELFYVRKLSVKPCLGDFACWVKTPGRCSQRDDMDMLLPKLAEADLVVLATPVYVDGMTGALKTIIDRMVPLVQPFFELREDHCRHPRRYEKAGRKLALVSVSGFTELDNFDPLVTHVKAIGKNMGTEYAGAVLRPYAMAMPYIKRQGVPIDDVFEAFREAGRQLGRDGRMDPATLATASREMVPRDLYISVSNASFQRNLDALAKAGAD